MRIRFVEEHRDSFPAKRLCHVVGVSTRGLRAFRSRPASHRQRFDLVTLAHIKEQSRLCLGRYARPRMTEELKEIGLDVGHRRVGRLMRENGRLAKFAHAANGGKRERVCSNPGMERMSGEGRQRRMCCYKNQGLMQRTGSRL